MSKSIDEIMTELREENTNSFWEEYCNELEKDIKSLIKEAIKAIPSCEFSHGCISCESLKKAQGEEQDNG